MADFTSSAVAAGGVNLGDLITYVTADTSGLIINLNKADKRVLSYTKRVDTYLKKHMASWKAATRQMAIGGAAVVGGIGLLMREYLKLDEAMRVSTAVSTLTGVQYERMTDMAVEASKRWGMSATQLAGAFYHLGSAGLSATEQIQAFNPAIVMATAGVMDAGHATRMLINTMRGFQVPFKDVAKVSDILTKSTITALHTMEQVGEAFHYVAGQAHQANNTIAETAAILGFMADMGISGSLAGTVLRRALINLMAPTSAIRDELAKWNVEVYDANGNMKPMIVLIGELNDALRGASPKLQNMAYRVIFGARAISGMTGVLSRGSVELAAYAETLKNPVGTGVETAEKQMLALSKQIGRLRTYWQSLARTLASTVVPQLAALVQGLIPVVQYWDDLANANRGLVGVVIKLTTVIGGLVLVLGVGGRGLIWVVSGSIIALQGMYTAVGLLTKGLIALNIATVAMAATITTALTVGLIAAAAAIIYFNIQAAKMEEHLRKIRKWSDSFMDASTRVIHAQNELQKYRKATAADAFATADDLEHLVRYSEDLLALKKDQLQAEQELLALMEARKRRGDYGKSPEDSTMLTDARMDVRRTRVREMEEAVTREEAALAKLHAQHEKAAKGIKDAWLRNPLRKYFISLQTDFKDTEAVLEYTADQWKTSLEGTESAFSEAMHGMAMGTETFTGAIKGMAVSVLETWSKMITDMIAHWVMFRAVQGVGSMLGLAMVAPSVPALGAASIATASQPETSKAAGGIITRPTQTLLGEGNKAEAVIPLDKLQGMQSGITINIVNPWDGASVMRAVESRAITAVLRSHNVNGPIRKMIRGT